MFSKHSLQCTLEKIIENFSLYLLFSNYEEHPYFHRPISAAACICVESKTDRQMVFS